MKKKAFGNSMAILVLLLAGLPALVLAKPNLYKWVKDKQVSSAQALPEALSARVLPLPAAEAMAMIRAVMADDLKMVSLNPQPGSANLEGETSAETILPEALFQQKTAVLADESFRFVLEVRVQSTGGKTRVQAVASPIYRTRDKEKEEERDGVREDQPNRGMRIAESSQVGVMNETSFLIIGLPSDFQIEALPDAADRAGKLVRSFFYLLEKHYKSNPGSK